MYNFIINLFSEDDYSALLDKSQDGKRKKNKILIVPPSYNEKYLKIKPVCLSYESITESMDEIDFLSNYPKRESLLQLLTPEKFINPTHNNSNNIGGSNALLSHSPTHFKITDAFVNEKISNEYEQDFITLEFTSKKIVEFKKRITETEYYKKFPELIEYVISFFEDFSNEEYSLNKNDYIVFLVDEDSIDQYLEVFKQYVNDKILKYGSYEGECNACKNNDQLYALTHGNTFDLGKERKYLLRNPTRYKTNLKSKSSENYNICRECSMQLYYFFEYLKSYKFYRYVFPIKEDLFNQKDYRNYASDPPGILKILKKLYEKNNFREFDYVMVLTDPSLDNIEFRYVSNFNYQMVSPNIPIDIKNISLYYSFQNSNADKGYTITNEKNKSVFLGDISYIFNNTLVPSLFETDKKNLIKVHPFIQQKILEYNFIIRNYIFYQDNSLFIDNNYSKMFTELLYEMIKNINLRNEMKLGSNKIRQFLIIYYKYLHNEPNGGIYLDKYKILEEKLKDMENIKIENDFEASYLMGQLFRYLLGYSESIKNRLDLFTKYTLNVHNMEYLKKRLLDVLEKYSYNEYIDRNVKFQNVMKSVLAYEFLDSYENNKIPLYTGYFDNNYLYGSKKEIKILEEENKEVE